MCTLRRCLCRRSVPEFGYDYSLNLSILLDGLKEIKLEAYK